MKDPAVAIAAVILFSLIIYALSGGADFGGGVLDLIAFGPRARDQRRAIAEAIGPIWEANHIWMILIVVLLFSAFPSVFSAISIALVVPLNVMLIGIILRGSAFIFRRHSSPGGQRGISWGDVFAASSVVTPVALGVIVGSIASGGVQEISSGMMSLNLWDAWLSPFPLAIGFLTVALFTFLAAVYLTVEVQEPELKEDFRLRALASGIVIGLLAWLCYFLAGRGAPLIRLGLEKSSWSILFQIITAIVSGGALWALWLRYFRLARILAVLETVFVILGWGLSQYPYILPPTVTFQEAAASASVLRPLLGALLVGVVVLIPSFVFLFWVFKGNALPVRSKAGSNNAP